MTTITGVPSSSASATSRPRHRTGERVRVRDDGDVVAVERVAQVAPAHRVAAGGADDVGQLRVPAHDPEPGRGRHRDGLHAGALEPREVGGADQDGAPG